ncbi:hypothetical protein [Sediminibacterium goheungense]|uniref:DUF4468 domain-containing protein n=1 Tax=Sediminibacterium goheungense TaxID=1086393 RepID=A0A4R6J1F4_9BACT|nr:hypothetical protein [Sediminibacterium goheungense]TDO28086.1 hypothetical protein BC659_0144 [Sediminibacterium goheungense]
MRLLTKTILVSCLLLTIGHTASAQENEPDPVFIQHYKTFRAITDSLSSYALYLVPYGSSNKIRLTGAYQSRLSKVYHFLKRNKKIDFDQPDFIIGILIDDEQIEEPKVLANGRSGGYEQYIIKVTYRYKVNFLIHTKDRKELRFNLGGIVTHEKAMPMSAPFNEIRDSISRRGYSMYPQPQAISIAQIKTPQYGELQMFPEDYQMLLSKLLDKFTNYYVDRVDN